MKLFIVVPADLPRGYRIPQAVHVAVNHVHRCRFSSSYVDWYDRHKTVIVYQLGNTLFRRLVKWVEANRVQIMGTVWREPDLADEPTAIALGPAEDADMIAWLKEATGQEVDVAKLAK